MSNNKTILPKIQFESIFLSIKTLDTYTEVIRKLRQYFIDTRTVERKVIEAYSYLVEQQLGNNLPTASTLIKSLEKYEVSFTDKLMIDDSDVSQAVDIFIKNDKNRKAAKELSALPELVLDHGVSHPYVLEVFNTLLSNQGVDGTYVPVSDNFRELYLNQVEDGGYSFLCPDLDKRTGGMRKGRVCTILGGPGSMKTTTAVNICYNAMKSGANIAYLSLEESPMQLYSKLLARVSVDVGKQLSTKDITQNTLEDKDRDILLNEIEPYLRKEIKGNLYILGEQDLGTYELTTMEGKLKEADMRARQDSLAKDQEDDDHGIDIVVVDHIQLLKYAMGSGRDEFSVINTYVSFFRQQSLSFLHQKKEVLVILLSQANRDGVAYSQKHDGQFLMQHVAEASEIERSSEYIISTYTDGMVQTSKLLKMGALKLRGAPLPLATVNVFADGHYYQVGETEIPEQATYSADDIGIDTIESSSDELLNLDDLLGGFGQ